MLHEVAAELREEQHLRVQLFATDLNPEGIDTARFGRYPANIEADVSPVRLLAYFTKMPDDGYQVRKELFEKIFNHMLDRYGVEEEQD